MLPGPLAAGIYASVKIAGYAGFAHGLNRVAARNVPPFKFAVAKTALGLVGGATYLLGIVPLFESESASDVAVWVGAIPIRLLVWTIALGYFYGFRRRPLSIAVAVPVGVAWSYGLDWLMSFLYRFIPGLAVPFC
jgi:hypothetical protein